MVLIFSQDFEETTIGVINWLNYYKASFIRVNGADWNPYKTDISFSIDADQHMGDPLMNQVNVVWYRRWGYEEEKKCYTIDDDVHLYYKIKEDLYNEYLTLRGYFFEYFKDKKWINHPDETFGLNKLKILQQASALGLCIPESFVTNSKSKLLTFFENTCKEQMIGKAIGDFDVYTINNELCAMFTHQFTRTEIEDLPDKFFPCMFQSAIPKEYEIRSFYLDGKFYSMAIFSQLDSQTSVDFRHYNMEKPNRNVPYQLSKETENKLKKLFKLLGYASGSADIIRGKDGKDYFLEINPVGQFGMVSHPCRYYLTQVS